MACIGGFTATSYASLAKMKGWPVGSLFDFNGEKMSYIIVGGLMCQYGSVIISFIVNPWWSAFIVLALGFLGYMTLAKIFKEFSQFISVILIIISFFLIPIYIFGN